jgi:predicted nucleic acid-binding protein
MSARRFSLDSNLLIYFHDPRDPQKQAVAQQIVTGAAARDCILGLQAAGEFYAAATRKKILTRADAARAVLTYLSTFATFAATENAHRIAAREAVAGRFS